MALTFVQQNIAVSMQNAAINQLELQNQMVALVAMWTAEGMGTLVDADLQALPAFAHITAAELQAAKGAMDTISTAVGAYAVGTPAMKLLKIVGNVPR